MGIINQTNNTFADTCGKYPSPICLIMVFPSNIPPIVAIHNPIKSYCSFISIKHHILMLEKTT